MDTWGGYFPVQVRGNGLVTMYNNLVVSSGVTVTTGGMTVGGGISAPTSNAIAGSLSISTSSTTTPLTATASSTSDAIDIVLGSGVSANALLLQEGSNNVMIVRSIRCGHLP